ncbi:MAG: lamin tail domain-containing protein [Akkermansiaceae bacterium]
MATMLEKVVGRSRSQSDVSAKLRVWLIVLGGLICPGMVQGQMVVISEAMASNGTVIADEDGEFSDWLELHNPTENAVSLNGWHLTDREDDLIQWALPEVTIESKGFLLVFASNKDRALPGSELHTNFKLSSSGEYLALVRPDGRTIEHEVVLPALEEDCSFGFEFPSVSNELIFDEVVPCKALIPTSEVEAWQTLEFDDSDWLEGMTGVGYEQAAGGTILYHDLIGLEVGAMRRVNASVFIRVPFSVSDGSRINGLTLKMKYEDAFVASLNGAEGARSARVPDVLNYNSDAEGSNRDDFAIEFEEFDFTPALGQLKEGANVLAIHGLNASATSNDLIFMPRLEAKIAGEMNQSVQGQLLAPTPARANTGVAFTDFVETPVTVPERGFYHEPIEVVSTTSTPGATLRYTTDGSEPTESSPVFPAQLTVSTTTNLRVKGFLEGARPSSIRTDTYLFLDDVITEPRDSFFIGTQQIRTGLHAGVLAETYQDATGEVVSVQDSLKAIPSLSITTNEANLFDPDIGIYVNATEKWERPVSAEWINPDGRKGFQIDAGLRIRGGFSRNPQFAKHGLRLFFRDEYGKGRLEYDFFEDGGLTSFKRMDLRTTQSGNWAGNSDPTATFLRDVVFRDSQRAMGDLASRSSWFHLYLNGRYWGMYQTEERKEANFGADHLGGDKDDYDLVKIWRPYNNQPRGTGFWIEEPAPDGNLDAYRRLHTLAQAGFASNEAYFAVQGMNVSGERDSSHERLLDVENMINYLLLIYQAAAVDNCITWWTGDDNILNNMYGLYNRKNPDGFKWFQHDGEIAYDRVVRRYPIELDRTGPYPDPQLQEFRYFNPQTLHEKLLVNPEYRIKLIDQVYKYLDGNGALTAGPSQARLDERAAEIDRAIVAHSARWGSTNLDRDSWVNAVSEMRGFFDRGGDRANEVIGYLDRDGLIPATSRPVFSLAPGEVAAGAALSLSGDSGTIYYTLDGSDPRAIGGAAVGTAYTEALSIDEPIHVKARVLNGGEWSALSEATFWNAEVPLVITEVMYHAPGGNQYEFIEIHNSSDQEVELKGYHLSGAVELELGEGVTSIAPGSYVVVVDDISAFSTLYPGVTIAGQYSGSLSNGGERITFGFYDTDLVSFRYSDARNWPQAADGAGHSLVPLPDAESHQERGSLDYGGNWRASSSAGGSPGAIDPLLASFIHLNEIIANSNTGFPAPFDSNDQIEVYNSSDAPMTLNGWFLSDDLDEPQKWPIPSGTVVPGMGHVVFDEDDFHPNRTSGFGIDRAGEQIVLSSANGVVDVIRFKAQDLGVSLGRYPDGSENWVITSPSPMGVNEPAPVSLQISQVMYHPLEGEREFIQIRNASNAEVPLANSAGAYRIDGGVSYLFSEGETLQARQRVWVVPFDPTNLSELNAFCAAHELDPDFEVFYGPFSGSLSNGGERVAIEAPQASAVPDEVSWIVIDELFYFDQAPWPVSADGTGYPLVRAGLTTWDAASADDLDEDQMNDTWELVHFGSLTQARPDWDGDGLDNLTEFLANTDPTDPKSKIDLQISGQALSWTVRPNRTYVVLWSDDLETPFVPIGVGINGTFTDTLHGTVGPNFYRLRVIKPVN